MRCRRLAQAILLPVLVGACARPAPTSGPGAALDVADAALSNGAPALALSVAQTEAARQPSDADILLREARAYAALSRWNDARRTYERVLQLDPDWHDATMELGKLVLFSDPTRARTLFSRVLASERGDAAALNDRGVTFDLLGDHPAAQADYRAAIGADPDGVAAKVNLALSLAIAGDPLTAVRLLRPLATGPDATPRIRQDLAFLLVRTNHDEEALATLRGDMAPDAAAAVVAHDRALLPGDNTELSPSD